MAHNILNTNYAHQKVLFASATKQQFQKLILYTIKSFSRVDTDVLMEVAYSCNFLAVSDSSTCPDIGSS